MSDIEFLSSSVKADDNEYDTSAFYGVEKVSMGSANNFNMQDIIDFFKEHIISTHTRLDFRNLAFVRYLNLRNSTIADVDTSFLLLLYLIDIAFSNI